MSAKTYDCSCRGQAGLGRPRTCPGQALGLNPAVFFSSGVSKTYWGTTLSMTAAIHSDSWPLHILLPPGGGVFGMADEAGNSIPGAPCPGPGRALHPPSAGLGGEKASLAYPACLCSHSCWATTAIPTPHSPLPTLTHASQLSTCSSSPLESASPRGFRPGHISAPLPLGAPLALSHWLSLTCD